MTGPVNFRAGFRPVRRDKLIQERVHDTYKTWGKLREPTVCTDCGAVYHRGRWQWLPRPDRPYEQACPACHRIRDRFPAGYIKMGGGFLKQHREEILQLVRNQGDKAQRERPLGRIIAIEERNGDVLVTTTDIHLARAIGEALEHAYQGTLDFHYNDAENLLRVEWTREEKRAPRRR